MKTAQQYEQTCIAQNSHLWYDDECEDHGYTLNRDGHCNECLDDAHEAWIMQRTDIR
jgi:hypothetical protein